MLKKDWNILHSKLEKRPEELDKLYVHIHMYINNILRFDHIHSTTTFITFYEAFSSMPFCFQPGFTGFFGHTSITIADWIMCSVTLLEIKDTFNCSTCHKIMLISSAQWGNRYITCARIYTYWNYTQAGTIYAGDLQYMHASSKGWVVLEQLLCWVTSYMQHFKTKH